VVVFGLGTSGVTAWLALRETLPELGGETWSVWLVEYRGLWLQSAFSVVVSLVVVYLLLRFLSPGRLGLLFVGLLAVCGSIVLGASGQPLWTLAPPLLLAAAGGSRAGLRRWRGATAADAFERALPWLVLALLSGLPISLWTDGDLDLPLTLAGGGLGVLAAGVLFGLLPLAAAGFLDMHGSVEWFIAVRYLLAKRRQVFISAITGICVVGIAAGVWLIVVVLSVMNGFEQIWRDEILGNRAHFTVHSGMGPFEGYEQVLEQVRQVPGVVAASPYIDSDGMVRGRGSEIYSVRVRGVDPVSVAEVTSLGDDLTAGSLSELVAGGEGADPTIVIGSQLARALAVGVGDDLLVISPFGGPPTPLGPAPRLKRFRVVGVFQSSFFQYDEVYTYVSLEAGQEFRRAGPVVDGVEALTSDFYRSRRIGQEAAARLGYPFYSRDWKDVFPAFFQALKTERVMMFLLLTMIMVVAAFVIVATLVMMIMEKSSDIAILKAMGAEDSMIERIFALEGTLIGLTGTALGVVAGIAVTYRLTWLQDQIEAITGIDTLPASVYQFSTLPSRVDPVQVLGVAVIAMVLSLGATLLPSRQGARIDPAEGLRHE